MKQLLIIRHAKSDWNFLKPNDFDRPLAERGHKDAPEMAKRLLNKKIKIDAFISSTALRAFTTATYFEEAYKAAGFSTLPIIGKKELYHAAPSVFEEVISAVDDQFNCIAVFSHNPGITYFVNELTSTKIDEMPTCGVFAVNIDTNKWSDFVAATKSFWFFDYPKSL